MLSAAIKKYEFGADAEVGGRATERHTVSKDRVPPAKGYGAMQGTAVWVDDNAVRQTELSPDERAILSRYPPESALQPKRDAIQDTVNRLTSKPEQARLEAAYCEAVEFGEYWAGVYEDIRLHGIRALEDYYEDTGFGELASTLEALDAILWALQGDIVRSRRDRRALALKYSLEARSDKTAPATQVALF